MTHVPDWILNLAWAWQMALMFGIITAALLAVVFLNDLPAIIRNYRRRHVMTIERRRS